MAQLGSTIVTGSLSVTNCVYGNLSGMSTCASSVCRNVASSGNCHVALFNANTAIADANLYTSNVCTVTFNPSSGVLTATTFCGNATSATNSTCFNGCTYECAKADIINSTANSYVWKCVLQTPNNTTRYVQIKTCGERGTQGITFRINNFSMDAELNLDNGTQYYRGSCYGALKYSKCSYTCANSDCFWLSYTSYRSPVICSAQQFKVLCTTTTAPSDITFCNFTELGAGSGTVTVTNLASCNQDTPIALCTGSTSIGKSTNTTYPLTFNTCNGTLKASCFCGSVSKFNGCTYAQACDDIRNGLVTSTTLASCGYSYTSVNSTTLKFNSSTVTIEPEGCLITAQCLCPIACNSNTNIYACNSTSLVQTALSCCNGLFYHTFRYCSTSASYKIPFTSLTSTGTAGCNSALGYMSVDSENTMTYNPSSNMLTVGCVCGKLCGQSACSASVRRTATTTGLLPLLLGGGCSTAESGVICVASSACPQITYCVPTGTLTVNCICAICNICGIIQACIRCAGCIDGHGLYL